MKAKTETFIMRNSLLIKNVTAIFVTVTFFNLTCYSSIIS